MDKNAIKKYAVWARRELITRVTRKAMEYGITEEDTVPAGADSAGERVFTLEEKSQRAALIEHIASDGYMQTIEEIAYTWFNRFCALRFMEVNGYLPSHVRVFTDDDNNFKPQIITEAIDLDLPGLDNERVYELKETNDTEALFKYLIITQCNALNPLIPGMFQKISDYTELLFPDNLLRDGSVIQQMIEMIPEEDWKDAVQIIGWLYQYYNSEKKDEVFAALKKNIKVTKENIPAATQLFTPDWIVRYMVENSLGRLWLEGHPNDELRSEWKYYLDEAEQEPEVQAQLAELRREYAGITPEEIRVIDPCAGSGHILVYAFDVLMQIYREFGYNDRDAARSILVRNLYGLDIDDRAAQLANFALMMKARQYDRRIFTCGIQPNVYPIPESNGIDKAVLDQYGAGMSDFEKECAKTQLEMLIDKFKDAKEYGAILNVDECNWELLHDFINARGELAQLDYMLYEADKAAEPLHRIVIVAEILARKYDVVVTNPPYMGSSNMNVTLGQYIKKYYTDYKSDFFSAFIIRASYMTKTNGYCGFFSPYVWMFIKSYEALRNYLYNNATIETLIQFEYSAFEEATVPVCTFVFQNRRVKKSGCYIRLVDFRGGMEVQRQKTLEAIADHNCGFYYEQNSDDFAKIPGSPVAYWTSKSIITAFEKNKNLSQLASPRVGLQTGANERFVRLWHEVDTNKTYFDAKSKDDAQSTGMKWFPYNKGGDFRKWYGNNEYIVNWEHDGFLIRHFVDSHGKLRSRPQNTDTYFFESITWSKISNGVIAFRYKPFGHIYDVAGTSIFAEHKKLLYLLAFCNSNVAMEIAKILSPTINYEVGHIARFPIALSDKYCQDVINMSERLIKYSKFDWDSNETSWDFVRHPLLNYGTSFYSGLGDGDKMPESYIGVKHSDTMHKIYEKNAPKSYTIFSAYEKWKQVCNDRFAQLKANEEDLNRIFIDIYGLQDELTPEVADRDVTVHRVYDTKEDVPESMKGSNYVRTKRDEVVSLISYAVGCMFGRYSLDVPGLAYAGGEWDETKYVSFPADKDNIIPICDDDYFADDIVGRFVRFIETAYGSENLEENLSFIADALGGKGSAREVIRSYFLNGFYADHCKTYQKRPIYWMFDSGKKNGFKALIYMHRYEPDTIARLRTDYVHEQQSRYRTAVENIEQRISGASTGERVKLNKQLKKLQDQSAEIHDFEEKIHHLADQYISIDLDDGVKVNYAKFQDVLAKIK